MSEIHVGKERDQETVEASEEGKLMNPEVQQLEASASSAENPVGRHDGDENTVSLDASVGSDVVFAELPTVSEVANGGDKIGAAGNIKNKNGLEDDRKEELQRESVENNAGDVVKDDVDMEDNVSNKLSGHQEENGRSVKDTQLEEERKKNVKVEENGVVGDKELSADGGEESERGLAAKESSPMDMELAGDNSELNRVKEENQGRELVAVSLEANDLAGSPVKEEILAGDADGSNPSSFDPFLDGDDSGTEEEQAEFMQELHRFYKQKNMEFKPPKFYGEGLNCLKLWRAVVRLGGYERVTTYKLWRQVGWSFKPPKTCTTVSWTFRGFYEKALLEYEKHKVYSGELQLAMSEPPDQTAVGNQVGKSQTSNPGRARRDAATRAMHVWNSRVLGNGEEKSPSSLAKRDVNYKSTGSLKRKKVSSLEHAAKVARTSSSQADLMINDVGDPTDWVKINVQRNRDCYEVYALVPGLLREEVHVQSDPAGRLIVSGEPEEPDNPWGVTPFKKVITFPSRIDPHQTSAVVSLHGQLFIRVPFEQPDL